MEVYEATLKTEGEGAEGDSSKDSATTVLGGAAIMLSAATMLAF